MNESPDYMNRNCLNCNCRAEMFNLLNQEELELVYRHKTTVMFRKGETIKKQGTAMTHVISVNSGLVKVYIEGIDRRNTILRIVKPTNFIGGPGIYLDQVHHFSVSALQDTRVCLIEMQVFKSLLDRNKKFSEEFMVDFSRNTLAIYQRLINQTQKEVPGRMADTILYLLENIYNSSKFELHLTKQDLADISGMSKDSCVKILREFQREGIILQDRHELEITDLEKLKRISRLG
jgi:CRP/FNR family transcriptional regulator, polysaccharide utilization system transcription regulator